MKKRVFAMLMAAVMAFSLVACGNKTDNGGDAANPAETIKLGGVGPLTGGYANYGLSVQHGAELAAKERKSFMRFRGVNDISKRFRNGLWPVCPHCNELIDPMEISRFSRPEPPKEVE